MTQAMIRGNGLLTSRGPMPFCGGVANTMLRTHRTNLTARDRSALVVLTHRLKTLSVSQVRKMWGSGATVETVRRRLRRLCEAGWLSEIRVLVRAAELEPKRPLATWCPGQHNPGWATILAVTSARWRVPIHSVTAVVASTHAAKHFGGSARYPRPSEGTHDLFLSAVYLKLLRERQHLAAAWVGESAFVAGAGGGKGNVPDALVRMAGQALAIEVVGESYTASKLQAFHDYCRTRNWRYELW